MKSGCYFEECKDCIFKECNNSLNVCLFSRLSLALHELLVELPIINKFINKEKYCNSYIKE